MQKVRDCTSFINKLNFKDYHNLISMVNQAFGYDGTLNGTLNEGMYNLICNKNNIDSFFNKFDNKITPLSADDQQRACYLWIASLIFSSQQDLSTHTSGLGGATETTSFNMDIGLLTDSKNPYLNTLKSMFGIGHRSSVRMKAVSYGKNIRRESSAKNMLGYSTTIWGRFL